MAPFTLQRGDVLDAKADGILIPIDGTLVPRDGHFERLLGNVGRQFQRRCPEADLLEGIEAQLDLPLPLGRAFAIQLAAKPFKCGIVVSTLHHVDYLDLAAQTRGRLHGHVAGARRRYRYSIHRALPGRRIAQSTYRARPCHGPRVGLRMASTLQESMNAQTYRFEVEASSLEAFVGALLLGTLEAMRAGHWPLDAGIWTIGRPKFCHPLERAQLPQTLLRVLQTADELSALAELAGRPAADTLLDELIAGVRAQLESSPGHAWDARVVGLKELR